MVWDRFHFWCRQYDMTLQAESSIELYGEPLKQNSIPFMLLDTLKTINDPEKVKRIAGIYGKLDFASALDEPPKLRRITAYIVCLTIVFFCVCSIYQYQVAPQFVDILEDFEVSPSNYLSWYKEYWHIPILLVSLITVFFLAIALQVKRLFAYKNVKLDSLFCKLFLSSKIKKSYANILEIISFPLSEFIDNPYVQRTLISNHLAGIETSGLKLETEMNVLLRREGEKFALMIERYLLSITVLIGITIIASIFVFLSSAYAPIFMMGEVL